MIPNLFFTDRSIIWRYGNLKISIASNETGLKRRKLGNVSRAP
jgi:hypothetical protein